MFKWFSRWRRHRHIVREKKKYKAVLILYAEIEWTDKKRTDKIAYVLKENGYGDREVDIHEEGYAKIHNYGKRHRYYLKRILPWKEGLIDYEQTTEGCGAGEWWRPKTEGPASG